MTSPEETTPTAGGNEPEVPAEMVDTATTAGTEKSEPKPETLLSQEEVNKLIGKVRQETREKAAERALEDVFKRTGVQSLEELEAVVKEYKEQKLASLSEQERLQAELEEAQQKAAEIEAAIAEREAAAQEALVKAAVVSKAAGQFHDAEAVYRLLDFASLSIAEDGSVEGIDEALAAIAEKYPFMVKKNRPGVSPANPPEVEPRGRTDEDRRAEYFGIRSARTSPFFQGGGLHIEPEKNIFHKGGS